MLDRGLWTIEVAIASSWQSVYLTALALAGHGYLQRALSHAEQAQYAREALALVPTGYDAQQAALGRVTALGDEIRRER